MKKTYFTTLLLLSFVYLAIGQSFHPSTFPTNKNLPFAKHVSKHSLMAGKTTTPGASRWYNYGDAMDFYSQNNVGDSSILYGNNLFPDTTILVDYGSSGFSGPWIHNLGDILDVSSQYFNDALAFPGELALSKTSTFSVDSIGLWCIYARGQANASIVDTLAFEVAVNTTIGTAYFTSPIGQNLLVDSVFFKDIPFRYQTNTLDISTKQTYKVPLTMATLADSTQYGLHFIKVATPGLATVAAGKLVVSSVKFIPGYTWAPNIDTLSKTDNLFFLSYKEGRDRFPNYVKRDFNVSYIIPDDVAYNNASGWNGSFIPSFAYMGTAPTYRYEHHQIYYYVTCQSNCSTVSVENITANDANLNIYPNPSTGSTTLNYQLNVVSANVNIKICDVTGKLVKMIDEGKKASGKYIVNLNTSNLPAGIYYCKLTAGEFSKTSKLVIIR